MRMQISFTTTLAGLGRWFSRGKCLWHKHTRTWVWICSTYIQTGYGGRNRRVTGPLSRFNEWSCLREIRQGLTEQSTQPPPLAAAHVYPNTCCLPGPPHTHFKKTHKNLADTMHVALGRVLTQYSWSPGLDLQHSIKSGTVIHVFNFSTPKVKARESDV